MSSRPASASPGRTTPVEVCGERAVKGLYAFEPPTDPALVLRIQDQTPQESADAVHALLVERGLA